MGDMEYTPHPHATLLVEEEEDNTRETQEPTLKVPTSTSRDSESPITTPLVGISYNCPAFSESTLYQYVQL